jgi:hypothetical protein
MDGSWGFIHREGTLVISHAYQYVGSFRNGLAPVLIGKKWGYIDKAGRMAIQPQFKWADRFSEGLAPVSFDTDSEVPGLECVGNYGFIDTNGTLKIPAHFSEVNPSHFRIACVCEPPGLATGLLFKTLGYLVPAKVRCVERYIDQKAHYLRLTIG